jgi:hypothetical protein
MNPCNTIQIKALPLEIATLLLYYLYLPKYIVDRVPMSWSVAPGLSLFMISRPRALGAG